MATASSSMTTAELLALPDDGVERWLIRGALREKRPDHRDASMTIRNRFHSQILIQIGFLLRSWLDRQPEPRGAVLGGEVGVRLSRIPETTVGVDVVYISAEQRARQSDDSTLIDGPPILAVEILSPSDTQEAIHEKVDCYIEAGVALVWVIDPHDETVTVYRPDAEPELVNVRQELTAEPHLSGFRVAVSQIFQ